MSNCHRRGQGLCHRDLVEPEASLFHLMSWTVACHPAPRRLPLRLLYQIVYKRLDAVVTFRLKVTYTEVPGLKSGAVGRK